MYLRRSDLRNVTVTNAMPSISKVYGDIGFSYIFLNIMEEFKNSVNLSFVNVKPDEGEWGTMVNGKWNGVSYRLTILLIVGMVSWLLARRDT